MRTYSLITAGRGRGPPGPPGPAAGGRGPSARGAPAQNQRAAAGRPGDRVGVLAMVGTLLAGVYGGYFGAAQGVLLIGLLGAVLDESLQRVNAAKNLLSLVVNFVAAITFLVVRPQAVHAPLVAPIAVGSPPR